MDTLGTLSYLTASLVLFQTPCTSRQTFHGYIEGQVISDMRQAGHRNHCFPHLQKTEIKKDV